MAWFNKTDDIDEFYWNFCNVTVRKEFKQCSSTHKKRFQLHPNKPGMLTDWRDQSSWWRPTYSWECKMGQPRHWSWHLHYKPFYITSDKNPRRLIIDKQGKENSQNSSYSSDDFTYTHILRHIGIAILKLLFREIFFYSLWVGIAFLLFKTSPQ